MRSLILVGPRGVRLRCLVAETTRERRRGLMGSHGLARDRAMLLLGASSVHTFGVGFPLVVARLDRELRVVDVRRVPPRRVLLPMARARHVLECAVGADVQVGDRLVARPGPVPQTRIARNSP